MTISTDIQFSPQQTEAIEAAITSELGYTPIVVRIDEDEDGDYPIYYASQGGWEYSNLNWVNGRVRKNS